MYFPKEAPPTLEALEALWAPYAGVFIGSLLISLLLTPMFRALAIRMGVYDMPDKMLKPHGRPIPYLGGLAIFLGIILPLVTMALLGKAGNTRGLLAVAIGATIVTGAGLLDDLVSLKPGHKILFQITGALVLAAGGVVFRAMPWELAGLPLDSASPELAVAAGILVQVFLVVAACNATNLLDGLDGLCSGVAAIIGIGFLLLATSITGWYQWGDAPGYTFSVPIIVISLALLGAAIGFLPYNFNPASIFMGDAGSMLLGFICAAMVIMFSERPGLLKWCISAMFIFGLPFFDTGLAFTRRWLNGKPIFQGDRSHFYDQLVDRGLSVKQAVLVCYGLALFFVCMGLGLLFVRTRYAFVIAVFVIVAIAVIVKKAGMLRVDRQAAPGTPVGTDDDRIASTRPE